MLNTIRQNFAPVIVIICFSSPAMAADVWTEERGIVDVSAVDGYSVVKLDGAKIISTATCTNHFLLDADPASANYQVQMSIVLSAQATGRKIRMMYDNSLNHTVCNVLSNGVRVAT